jgi:uncharacterized metal-binding protein
MTVATAIAVAGFHYRPELWPLWATAAVGCYLHEAFATADRDVEPSRKWWWGHWYWLPYGHMVGHRGWASHGLLIGTAIRLAYGWWWLLWGLWLLLPALAVAWCVGALANDVFHILLDL